MISDWILVEFCISFFMIKYSKFTDNIGSGNFTDTFCQNTNIFQKSVCKRRELIFVKFFDKKQFLNGLKIIFQAWISCNLYSRNVPEILSTGTYLELCQTCIWSFLQKQVTPLAVQAVNNFSKKFHHRCLTMFKMHLC